MTAELKRADLRVISYRLIALVMLVAIGALVGLGALSPARAQNAAPPAGVVAPAGSRPGTFEGVASCAGSTCHGRIEGDGKVVRQDELSRWQEPSSPGGAHSADRGLAGAGRGLCRARLSWLPCHPCSLARRPLPDCRRGGLRGLPRCRLGVDCQPLYRGRQPCRQCRWRAGAAGERRYAGTGVPRLPCRVRPTGPFRQPPDDGRWASAPVVRVRPLLRDAAAL